MAGLHHPHARLAAGVAVLSLLAACSGAPGGGFKGAGGNSSVRLAERSADVGDYATAEALYRQAFSANPNNMEALVGLGRSYAGLGQYARAEQALNEASRRRPNDPAVLLELARTQLGAGQAAAALDNLDKALAKRPRDVSIITARGIALDRLSRHAEAQENYRNGLERDPTNFALLSNLGLSLGLSGKTGEGIQILGELVRDGAANANTRGNLALVYGLAGREREAKATLAGDLPASAIQSNLVYYRELRGMLLNGKPIGNLGQPLATASAKPKAKAAAMDPLAAIIPVDPAPISLPQLAAATPAPISLPQLAAATPAPVPAAVAKATPSAATAANSAASPVATLPHEIVAATRPDPLPDFVPASGTFSSGIVPETKAPVVAKTVTPKKAPSGGGRTQGLPAILPIAPGE